MRAKIKKTLLVALLQSDGVPMPDEALVSAGINFTHPNPGRAEVESVVKELETNQFISRADNEITGRSWTLTDKGQHQAQKL